MVQDNRIKRRLFFILIITFVSLFYWGIYIFFYHFFSFKLIGDYVVMVGVNNNYFESGAISSFFDKKMDNIEISGNVDVTKIGIYNVKYTAKFLFLKKELCRTVVVEDLDKPYIELKGDKNIYLNLGEEYRENGYYATDNVDGDITSYVIVNNDLDINKVGWYKLVYYIKDSSMNENAVERSVEVVDNGSILQSSVADFTLDNSFNDVLLKYDSEHEYDYFKDIVFLGDSNVTYFYRFGKFFSADQTWGKNGLNIAEINSSTFTTFINGKTTNLNSALDTYKPKYLIASIGISTILGNMSREKFLRETQTLIDNMKNNYPETKLIFTSVLPLYTGTHNQSAQPVINEYNYYLLELCHKNKINFINFADRVKDQNGYASHYYFECLSEINCGFHLNSNGKKYYIDYIKHLDLGGI